MFVSSPLATLVGSWGLESPTRPDPLSDAVQVNVTLSPCQSVSGDPHDTVGALRSTLIPEYGPAVVEFPTASAKAWEPVEAFESSDPLGTLVLRVKLAGEEPFRPDPPSWAVQCRVMLDPCQAVSVASQVNVGA